MCKGSIKWPFGLYAHEKGYPWNEQICEWAASNGHLDCLQYAYENDCPMNEIDYCGLSFDVEQHLYEKGKHIVHWKHIDPIYYLMILKTLTLIKLLKRMQ